jgi:hypothetical protein
MDTVLLHPSSGSEEEEGNLIFQLFQDLVSSIFDGGVNRSTPALGPASPALHTLTYLSFAWVNRHRGLIIGMHSSFAGLVLVLLALYVLTEYNGHVLALSGISICLWATTTWCVLPLPTRPVDRLALTSICVSHSGEGRFVSELMAAQRAQAAEQAKLDQANASGAPGSVSKERATDKVDSYADAVKEPKKTK